MVQSRYVGIQFASAPRRRAAGSDGQIDPADAPGFDAWLELLEVEPSLFDVVARNLALAGGKPTKRTMESREAGASRAFEALAAFATHLRAVDAIRVRSMRGYSRSAGAIAEFSRFRACASVNVSGPLAWKRRK